MAVLQQGKRNPLLLAFALLELPALLQALVIHPLSLKHPEKPFLPSLLFLSRLRERHTPAREPGTGGHRNKELSHGASGFCVY